MKKKNFESNKPLVIATSLDADTQTLAIAETGTWHIAVPQNTASSVRNLDLEKNRGDGYDEIVQGFYHILSSAVKRSVADGQTSLSLSTITSYYRYSSGGFFPFLKMVSTALQRDLQWGDITPNLIKNYILHLATLGIETTSQKNEYSSVKGALVLCFKAGFLPQYQRPDELFPRNPYPNNGNKSKGEQRLSKSELKQVTIALRKELQRIAREEGPLGPRDMVICFLGIALRTGINTTPLLDLPVDCLQPHPLKANRRLLVAFKRRANSTQVHSIRESTELALIQSVMPDVADVVDLLSLRNGAVRNSHRDPQRLWVFKNHLRVINRHKLKDETATLSSAVVANHIKWIVDHHKIVNDDCKPLKLNVSRLRKTFVNRHFELSGQDPLIAARYGKHDISTADKHYWEAPPEAEKNFAYLGEVRVREMMDGKVTDLKKNTPVAGCKDPQNGHRAPKDGSPCTEVLACFRCRSCIVTQDDLYRLFSFYWSVIDDRHSRDTKGWRKLFRHIVRLIDGDIAPQFDPDVVAEMREKARQNRHPYWRDLTMLRMAR